MIAISPATPPEDFHTAARLLEAFGTWDAREGVAHGLAPDLVLSLFHGETAESLTAQYADTGATRLFIAREGDVAAGCLGVAPFDDGRLELHGFYVDPIFRGRGVGRGLVQATLDFAAATRSKTVLVQTTRYMQAALVLYEAMGFSPCPAFRQIPEAVVKTEVFYARPV